MIQAGFGIFRMFERGEGCLLHHHRIYKVEKKNRRGEGLGVTQNIKARI